ncbi:hypothetical protein K1719_042050 [Acacia pycnantha]|nr:hypothetical protein K1719_042050 [Acacia pycnantha]
MSADQIDSNKPSSESNLSQPKDSHTSNYTPYPKLYPKDVAPPQENWTSVSVSQQPINATSTPEVRAPISEDAATTLPKESNPWQVTGEYPSKEQGKAPME